MDLSIVIVNYNVRYFLEQCLQSVFQAASSLRMEVLVVDNHSVDASTAMVREKFPNVRLICNKENLGFSKACNQGIQASSGRYVLLLNPDTVVEHDTLLKVVHFMDKHPQAGALGVKMLDGQGNFLPESKRGLPTPSTAFFKIFGLSALFPKSRLFGKYHLGYLDADQTHEVEVLSGAFMLLRREALNKTGLLDEAFFMYGEDIDLSYRMTRAGFRVYYFPEARIIHYKGESTKKSSVNYVLVFYKAMLIFARKHFSQGRYHLLSVLIRLAVYFRAMLALASRFLQAAFWPLADALLIYTGFHFIRDYWEKQVLMAGHPYYPPEFMLVFVPAMIACWLVSVYLNGGYDTPLRMFRIFRGIGLGTVFILVVYALLPLEWRFSRGLILLGGAWALIAMLGVRWLSLFAFGRQSILAQGMKKRVAVVGEPQEAKRIHAWLKQSGHIDFLGTVSSAENQGDALPDYLGNLSQLREIVDVYRIDELVFCAASLPSQHIIDQMTRLNRPQLHFKIAPADSLFLVGSNSIDLFEDAFSFELNTINRPANRRLKRSMDLLLSFFILLGLPLHLLLVNRPKGLLKNLLGVLKGSLTWVGYHPGGQVHGLPSISRGVLSPADAIPHKSWDNDSLYSLNKWYAKDYKPMQDARLFFKGYQQLGRSLTV